MRDQWRRRMARLIQDKVSIQAALVVKAAFVRDRGTRLVAAYPNLRGLYV